MDLKKTAHFWSFAKYPVLFGILAFVLYQCRDIFEKAISHGVDSLFLIEALFVFQCGVFLLAWRLQLFLTSAGIQRGYLKVLRAYLESVPYYFISPSGLGLELARYIKLKPKENEKASMVISLLVDRVAGVVGAVCVSLFGAHILLELVGIETPKNVASVIFVILLLCFCFVGIILKITSIRNKILTVLNSYRTYKAKLGLGIVISVFIQLSIGLSTYLIACAFGMMPDLYSVLWVSALGMVLIIIPASILGFNLLDIPTGYIYSFAGFPLADATFLILIAYFLRVWLAVQGGILEMVYHDRLTVNDAKS